MRRRFLSVVSVAVVAAGCGGSSVLERGGTRFAVSSTEADMAHEYERTAPHAPLQAACDYWNATAHEIAGWSEDKRVLGIFVFKDDKVTRSDGFKAWGYARRNEVCEAAEAEAKAEAKRKAEAYAAGEPERQARRQAERDEEERRGETKKRMVEDEITSGKCSQPHVDYLRQGLGVFASYLEPSGRSTEFFDLGAHAFAVATDAVTEWTLQTGLGGEQHILAVALVPFSPSGTSFQVVDDQGYPVKTESRLENAAYTAFNLPTAGFALQANANETLKMKLRGHGCVLLFVVRRY